MTARRVALTVLALGLGLLLVWVWWPDLLSPGAGSPDQGGGAPAAGGTAPGGPVKATADGIQERTEASLGGAAPPAGATFQIDGLVEAVPGAGLEGMRVLAYRGDAGDSRSFFQSMMGSLARAGAEEPELAPLIATGTPLAETAVAADGTFQMAGLAARHLRLVVDHDFYGLHGPEPVQIDAETRNARVWLKPYLGGLLLGRVLCEDSAAGREVRMNLEANSFQAIQDPQGFLGAILSTRREPVTTDGGGAFRFRAVPPGMLLVLHAADETGAGRMGLSPMSPGETRESLLPLLRPARLAVVVRGTDGAAIEGAQVTLRPTGLGGSSGVRGDQGRATDANGSCSFAALVPGDYRVQAQAGGHVGATIETAVGSGHEESLSMTLGIGGSVEGIVVDAADAPIAGAHVAHFPSMEVPLIGDIFSSMGVDLLSREAKGSKCVTDAQGRFLLSGIEDHNPFHVVALHDDFAGGATAGVTMGSRDIRVVLRRAGGVRGRALAAEDGSPLRSFEVEASAPMFLALHRPVRQQRVSASADGAFLLENVPPGSYRLTARAEGRGERAETIQVAEGAVTEVGDVALLRAARVRGIVRTDDGQPVADATVRVRQGGMLDNVMLAQMMGDAGTRTDRTGSFELRDLSAGRLILLASAKGHATGRSPRLDLEAGQILDPVEIVLGKGGAVRGHVMLPPGERVEEWMVFAKEMQSGNTSSGDLGNDGSFLIGGLDPGQYEVQALRPSAFEAIEQGNRSWHPGKGLDFRAIAQAISEGVVSRRCTVRSGDETEVVLDARDLGLGGRLTLRVLMGESPLDSGIVELTQLTNGRTSTGFLDNGEATFSGMSPGALRVQIRGGLALTPVGDAQHIQFPTGTDRHTETLHLPGGELHGRVVDARTGAPLRDLLVRLLRGDAAGTNDDPLGFALTGADGAFHFLALGEGTYGLVAADELAVREGGSSAQIAGVRLAAGEVRRDLELRTRPGGGMQVLVTGPDGNPVAGALVTCVDPEGRPLVATLLATSGPDGVVHLSGLPTGSARVVGRAPGTSPAASPILQLQSEQMTETTLALGSGTRVILQPMDREGQALRGARLSARFGDGPWIPATLLIEQPMPDGSFDLGRLSAGEWEFRIDHPGTGTFVVRRRIAGAAMTLACTPE